jgi:hypothetical protein
MSDDLELRCESIQDVIRDIPVEWGWGVFAVKYKPDGPVCFEATVTDWTSLLGTSKGEPHSDPATALRAALIDLKVQQGHG